MNRIMWNEKMELSRAKMPASAIRAVGLDAVAVFVKQVAQALRRSLTRLAIERELSALDDRSLADIGVIRANIGTVAAAASGGPDLGSAFVGMLQNALLVPFKLWRERSRTEADLNRLSDRELLDIGLSRADIAAIVGSIGVEHVQGPVEVGSGEMSAAAIESIRPEQVARQDVGVVRGDIRWLPNKVANRNRPNGMQPSAA